MLLGISATMNCRAGVVKKKDELSREHRTESRTRSAETAVAERLQWDFQGARQGQARLHFFISLSRALMHSVLGLFGGEKQVVRVD